MARPLRFQYAGATYHVMARGDGGKAVFEEDKDRFDFLGRLGKVCASHGWWIHAWVLMGNHFHLLVETPEPNLVTGMKTLLGGFSQAWNRRRKRMGHVFQGRYKSVPVSGEDSDPWCFRIVADYGSWPITFTSTPREPDWREAVGGSSPATAGAALRAMPAASLLRGRSMSGC